MADSNISTYENSTQDGQPLECYKFFYGDTTYQYTSSRYDVALTVTTDSATSTETYTADHIKRDAIKPSSKGSSNSTVVTVDKDNAVAALFKASPPDKPVYLNIFRLHDQDHAAYDTIFVGEIIEAAFEDSECNLTVKMENWLTRKLPNFTRQFFCCNVIYDASCRLNKADHAKEIYIDGYKGLTVTVDLTGYEDDYFAGGLFYYNNNVRMITASNETTLTLRYPFPTTPMGNVTIYPGCDKLFKTCATRYDNTLNYTGCPYVPPEFSNDDKVGSGVYWVDSTVVQRDTDGYIGTISL
ncbi:phage BR0599 family protein [Sporomusa aerivorans]|uniref:phage BR0599 family protein n=1 Tax=Sporomusa aerivorans TaxID=204936 RepID=UPI00352B7BC1